MIFYLSILMRQILNRNGLNSGLLARYFLYIIDHTPVRLVHFALILPNIDKGDAVRLVGMPQGLADYVHGDAYLVGDSRPCVARPIC